MAKDSTDDIVNDDEYKFVDTNNSSVQEPEKKRFSASMDVGSKAGVKKPLMIIGLLLVTFFLYKLYELFSTSPALGTQKVSTSLPHGGQRKVASPVSQMKVLNQTSVSTSDAENNKSLDSNIDSAIVDHQKNFTSELKSEKEQTVDLSEKITTLEQTVNENGKTAADLQQQIAGLSTAISDIQNNIAILTQKIGAIVQSQQAAAAEKRIKAKEVKQKINTPIKKVKSVKLPVFYLKALIQGRAWLIGQDGALMTVSVGDSLPGYGQIQNIDSDKSTISTSSGRIIDFMSGDK